jgi:hypothetical protein
MQAHAGLDPRSTMAKCHDGALWTKGLVVQVCVGVVQVCVDVFYLFVALQACRCN